MDKKRTYFPHTTAQQRRLLFETWEEIGNVQLACQKAHVCKQTFYNWKPRYIEGGYEALEQPRSHAPKDPKKTPADVEEKVKEIKGQHPQWGKRRIADELAKGNNWVPLVSHNTVKRILKDAGLWQEETGKKGGLRPLFEGQRSQDKP